MPSNKIFVERHSQPWAVRDGDPAIGCLNRFMRKFVSQWRILDAVFKKKGVAACAQPMQARGGGDWAGVAVVAQTATNFLDPLFDVVGVGESVASQINLIDIQRRCLDQRSPRLAATLLLAGGNRQWRAIAEPLISSHSTL